MAFDGITVAALVHEFGETLTGGHIAKIVQTEKDELCITVKADRQNHRLVLSAHAGLPLTYLTDENKTAPLTAPNFCMLLRKHIGGGLITGITQPGLERCIRIHIRHRNELGDLCDRVLIMELMGKYSNIIFCDDEMKIIDSIRRVPATMSSVREVLPGRPYFLPQTQDKADPLSVADETLAGLLARQNQPAGSFLSGYFTGISRSMAAQIVSLSGVDPDRAVSALDDMQRLHLAHCFTLTMEDVSQHRFDPVILYRGSDPVDFSAFPFPACEAGCHQEHIASMSQVIRNYYAHRDRAARIRQKSADLRRVISSHLEKDYKKLDLQKKQLQDTEKRDKYRLRGELIQAYAYNLKGGESVLECIDYHTGEAVSVPLDPARSAMDNAAGYFARYNKLKRTREALLTLTAETEQEIRHLESISTALDMTLREEDLEQIRQEMNEYGFIRRHGPAAKKQRMVSRPFHYRSSEGFDIYVGKNNYQNEELTFRFASGNDWWFHAKQMPGSHVIVKAGDRPMTDKVYEEAAGLAAYYSKGRDAEKVEVDYVQRREVKKVNGSAPGFVIYHTNYSMMAIPSDHLERIE